MLNARGFILLCHIHKTLHPSRQVMFRIERPLPPYPAKRWDLPFCYTCRHRHSTKKTTPILRLPDEILSLIIEEVPLLDRQALMLASLHMEYLISDPTTTRVMTLLTDFDLDPHAFIQGLDYTGAIIGGMGALHVFDEKVPTPDVLEVYCEGLPIPGTAAPDEQLYDQTEDGGPESKYRLDKIITLPEEICTILGYEYYGQNVKEIRRMVHRTSDQEILLISSKVAPVALLTEAPTTLLMNFIGAEKAVCLYPKHVWLRTGLLTVPVPADGQTSTKPMAALDRLIAREFTIVANMGDHHCGQDPICPDIVRRYPGPCNLSIPGPPNMPLRGRMQIRTKF
ncbi:hypothetical protein DFP72DRAFT_1167701 [Ephemerocybe angulata]|uniref:F-box domain-containing protein n=1 Tax=Ephemerocybe angulata TaxID=980116 RepID=A0A8H6I3U8_9AGAR|nr:hypothetical protein DFP72DRAFT_1167701 [Tulosesus angulatus]